MNHQQLEPVPGWGHSTGAIALPPSPSSVADDLLGDRLLIADVIYRYGWAFDERQADMLSACFTDDATWEAHIMGTSVVGPHVGREAIMEFMTGFWPAQEDQRRHMIMNVLIEDQSANAATILSYHLLTSAAGGSISPVTAGFYKVHAVKTGDSWRIQALLAGYDVPF